MVSTFAAIDFETATNDRNSACAVGVVVVEDGQAVAAANHLIQPPGNEYSDFNSSIHGITAERTLDAKPFELVWAEVLPLVVGRVLIAHNAPFDMSVLRHSAAHRGCALPDTRFACIYSIAKRTWLGRPSYRLPDLARAMEIELKHHDPLSDAYAAASITLAALDYHSSLSVEALSEKMGYRIGQIVGADYQSFSNSNTHGYPAAKTGIRAIVAESDDFDEWHPFYGRSLLFTGVLGSMTRLEAQQQAVNVGAAVKASVGKSLDYLVVGDLNETMLAADGLTSKLRDAMALSAAGEPLEIISEVEFLEMLNN